MEGRNFRDIYVNADRARVWLTGAGKPPPSAEIAVRIKTPDRFAQSSSNH
jgi:hypothetical protein